MSSKRKVQKMQKVQIVFTVAWLAVPRKKTKQKEKSGRRADHALASKTLTIEAIAKSPIPARDVDMAGKSKVARPLGLYCLESPLKKSRDSSLFRPFPLSIAAEKVVKLARAASALLILGQLLEQAEERIVLGVVIGHARPEERGRHVHVWVLVRPQR